MSSSVLLAVFAASISLLGSGGIFALSLFDIPELRAQPASRSLPSVRWLFSRGSHIFPTAAAVSSAAFALLAYQSAHKLPHSAALLSLSLLDTRAGRTVAGYALASALSISIAPFTQLMLPTNFELIRLNIALGGSRSQASAVQAAKQSAVQQAALRQRTAKQSVNGEGEFVNEQTDLSGPQEKAPREASAAEEARVQELLSRFALLNAVRGVLLGAGGIVGLLVALSAKA
ncbi:hypothetical protein MMC34_008695 [Xylographa carneopallida]|nr:hypothetical protein [Xylographa carneopallida]